MRGKPFKKGFDPRRCLSPLAYISEDKRIEIARNAGLIAGQNKENQSRAGKIGGSTTMAKYGMPHYREITAQGTAKVVYKHYWKNRGE